MRFIIHEQPYERPLLAGRLRYEVKGEPTGAVESWRLTAARDGYRFLRVDLDARDAPSGRSWLFHLTLNPTGGPEQLKYRYWGDGHEVSGTAVWTADEIIAARRVDGVAYEDVAAWRGGARHGRDGRAFWFPAGAGLALLGPHSGEARGVTMTAHDDDPARLLALVETPVAIEWGPAETVTAGGEVLAARPLRVAWGDQRRAVLLDAKQRPLRVWRNGQLVAVQERLVRYE